MSHSDGAGSILPRLTKPYCVADQPCGASLIGTGLKAPAGCTMPSETSLEDLSPETPERAPQKKMMLSQTPST